MNPVAIHYNLIVFFALFFQDEGLLTTEVPLQCRSPPVHGGQGSSRK